MRIIQFDHISYIEERKNKEKIVAKSNNFGNLVWTEANIAILDSKVNLLNYPQSSHDIYFMSGDDYSTEIILYDRCRKNPEKGLIVNNSKLVAYSNSDEALNDIMDYLGAKKDKICDGVYNLSGLLDKNDILIDFEINHNTFNRRLDDEGYGCITLLVNEISEYDSDCFRVTKPEQIKINNKNLVISFLYSENISVIFELIKIGR